MEIELLVVPDCPHRKAAEDLLRTALADVGLPSDFRVLTVSDAGDAARHGFAGSPTFRAAGADLFPGAHQPAGLNCRIYQAGATLGGLPDLRDLRQALKRAAESGGHSSLTGQAHTHLADEIAARRASRGG